MVPMKKGIFLVSIYIDGTCEEGYIPGVHMVYWLTEDIISAWIPVLTLYQDIYTNEEASF